MRLDIRYITRFDYTNPVRESANELRACPTTDGCQQLVSYRVEITPPVRMLSSVDYWGTRLDAFSIREPHHCLEIIAEAVVETSPRTQPESSSTLADVRTDSFRDAHVEYLAPTAHATWGAEIADRAWDRVAQNGDRVIDTVHGIHRLVSESLSYVTGATYVGVPIDEVLASGAGVCQDFAHLAIAMYRSVGIPARYVSGYLFTADDATGGDVEDDLVRVQTHAWVEAAVPDAGWIALDPTNDQPVGERHVKIGHGRDYDDVPPLKGAFSGPPEHDLQVVVEMRRSAAVQQQQ